MKPRPVPTCTTAAVRRFAWELCILLLHHGKLARPRYVGRRFRAEPVMKRAALRDASASPAQCRKAHKRTLTSMSAGLLGTHDQVKLSRLCRARRHLEIEQRRAGQRLARVADDKSQLVFFGYIIGPAERHCQRRARRYESDLREVRSEIFFQAWVDRPNQLDRPRQFSI
jgi:hypothetical protein